MKPIRIKEFFRKNKLSPSFMEIELVIPLVLKEFLKNNDTDQLIDAFSNIYIDKDIITTNVISVYNFLLYFITAFFVTVFLIIMILVHKNRDHPYLKTLSPGLCNIIILGIIISTFLPAINNNIYYKWECNLLLFLISTVSNLIILPMWLITYRIYSIFKNKNEINIGKKVNTTRLYIIFFIILTLVLAICLIPILTTDMMIVTRGNILYHRFWTCDWKLNKIHFIIIISYFLIVIISMLIMIITLGKTSIRFNEYKFIIIILLIFIFTNILYCILPYLPRKNFEFYYLILSILYFILHTLCIYLLVGSRLLYIYKHPYSNEENFYSINPFKCPINLSDFVSLDSYKNKSLFKKNSTKVKDKNSYPSVSDNDSFLNNPNNYFFNYTLKHLNK